MRKLIDKAAGVARYQFDTLSELGQYITDAPRTWGVNNAKSYSPSEAWDLGAGYDGAVRMAREGWLEGAREAEAALATFPPQDPAPDTVTDFYGHMPHVARYCAGAPDSMIRHAPQATMGGGRVLTLYVPVNANGNVSAQHMRNFGLGVAQYVNELETAKRIRCEVYGTATSVMGGGWGSRKSWRVTHTWLIKHADQPLDLAVLAFSIGHPAMLRRLEFALCERCASPESPGYGSAAAAIMADLIDPPAGAYILNGMDRASSVARTPADALAFIEAQITKALDNPEAE